MTATKGVPDMITNHQIRVQALVTEIRGRLADSRESYGEDNLDAAVIDLVSGEPALVADEVFAQLATV